MTSKTINTNIEILGKSYPIKCLESELASLQQAANFLNQQMLAVQESGKVIGLDKIAIITALNISNQFLSLEQQKGSLIQKINSRISALHDKLDKSLQKTQQTEMLYSLE